MYTGRVTFLMEREVQEYISYLHNVKHTSNNTEMSYKRDLLKVCHFMVSVLKSYLQNFGKTNKKAQKIQLQYEVGFF